MDTLDAMAVLATVADTGSLTAAARKLGTPLTTVSRKIADLQRHLGVKLFARTGRRLVLSDAGNDYVAACRRILEQVGEAERAVAGEYSAPRGLLVLAAPIVFGRLHVLPIVTAFLKAFPEIDVQLSLSDHAVNLVEEHVDAALRIGPLSDNSMTALKVGEIRRVICAAPSYLSRRGRPRSPADLAKHDAITFEGLRSPASWMFPAKNGQQAIAIHSRLVVNTAEAVMDAAAAGVGVTRVLYYQAAAALKAKKVELLLEAFEPEPRAVHLVHMAGRQVPLKVRAFLDFAAPRLRKVLAAHAGL